MGLAYGRLILKETGSMIGKCGLTMQDWNGKMVPEISCLFEKAYWHLGYASEAAKGCKEYAFQSLKLPRVYSIIRDNSLPSQRVAERNGMKFCGSLVKHYYGLDMARLVFCVENIHR